MTTQLKSKQNVICGHEGRSDKKRHRVFSSILKVTENHEGISMCLGLWLCTMAVTVWCIGRYRHQSTGWGVCVAGNHRAPHSQIPHMSYSPGGQEANVPEALTVVQERLLVTVEGGCSAGKRIRVISIISCSHSSLPQPSSILEMPLYS